MAGPELYDDEKGTGGSGDGTTEVGQGNKYAIGNDNVINERADAPKMTDTKSTTGSGLESALGTQYSWEKNATDRANLTYQSDVLTAKQNYLQQRQNIEQQGQQMQKQYDMEQYHRNQSAEKVGWTGGYALDEKRQMDYLKSTIQSQMYGSMELQKYGYDTSLAAARLAYDTNKYDLALEYYNTALSRAVTEAELTGVYVSPEANEMKSQFFAAEEKLKENPNDENAQRVKNATKQWFESNNISENGIYTFSALMELNTLYESMWATIEDTYKDTDLYQMDADTFINVNATQQDIALNGFGAYKINFNQMSGADIIEYIKSDSTGRAAEQYLSSLDSAGDSITNSIINKLKEEEAIYTTTSGTGENATEVWKSKYTQEDLRNKILTYFKEDSNVLKDALQNSLNKFNEEEQQFINEYLNNYKYTIELPGNLGGLEVTINTETNKTSLTEDAEKVPSSPEVEKLDYLKDLDSKEDLFKLTDQLNYEGLLNGITLDQLKNVSKTGYINHSDEEYEILNKLKKDWANYFGKVNLEYAEDIAKEYDKMSTRERMDLDPIIKERYETISEINSYTKAIEKAYKESELYTTAGDSGWERTGEAWERIGEGYSDIWNDKSTGGFGKVGATVIWTVGSVGYGIGVTAWEGIRGLFNF